MPYELTTSETQQVRTQLGVYVKESSLSDVDIQSETNLGAASDFVFQKVIEFIDKTKLTTSQKTLVDALLDGSSDEYQDFVEDVLLGRQQRMYRRAVVYRTAGNCATIIKIVESDSVDGFSQSVETPTAEEKQNTLYDKCDDEIILIRDAFPSDPITANPEVAKRKSSFLSLMGTTGGTALGGVSRGSGGGVTTETEPFSITGLADGTVDSDDYFAFADSEGSMKKAMVSAILGGTIQAFDINGLTEITTRVNDDLIAIYDVSDQGMRKISLANVLSGYALTTSIPDSFDIDALTAGTVKNDSDTVAIYDASANAMRKITLEKLLAGIFDINGLSEVTTKQDDDFVAIYDDSTNGLRKIKLENLLANLGGAVDINGQATLADVESKDELLIYDVSATTLKKISWGSIFSNVPAFDISDLTAETTKNDADTVAIYDASAKAMRKMTLVNLLTGVTGTIDINSLQTLTDVEGTDELLIYDKSGTVQRKIAWQSIFDNISAFDINGLTAETTKNDADTVAIYDASAKAMRKMTVANLLTGLSGGGGNAITFSSWTPTVAAASQQTHSVTNAVYAELSSNWYLCAFEVEVDKDSNWNIAYIVVDPPVDQTANNVFGVASQVDNAAGQGVGGDSLESAEVSRNGSGKIEISVRKKSTDGNAERISAMFILRLNPAAG